MQDKLQEYISNKGFYSFEGYSGVQNFETIIREVCGYGNYNTMDMFLQDNPGCLAAMIEWIGCQRVCEWERNLDEQRDMFEDESGYNDTVEDSVGD